jgi:hypothetical protein
MYDGTSCSGRSFIFLRRDPVAPVRVHDYFCKAAALPRPALSNAARSAAVRRETILGARLRYPQPLPAPAHSAPGHSETIPAAVVRCAAALRRALGDHGPPRSAVVHSETIPGVVDRCAWAGRRVLVLDPLPHRGTGQLETILHGVVRCAPADHGPPRSAAVHSETIPRAVVRYA